MRRVVIGSLVWALVASCAAAFIVPEELVSFLSIVYSNIPPVRKGTDSRVGVGFRLGPHADAQVVLELGPQTNTRPLGAAAPSFAQPSASKRHSPQPPPDAAPSDNDLDAPAPSAASWLSAWRTAVAAQAVRRPPPPLDDNLVQEVDAALPPDPSRLSGAPLVSHLRKLYANTARPSRGNAAAERPLPLAEDLTDVNVS